MLCPIQIREVLYKYDIVYHAKFPKDNCTNNYAKECTQWFEECVSDHNGRDIYFHVVKDFIKKIINVLK